MTRAWQRAWLVWLGASLLVGLAIVVADLPKWSHALVAVGAAAAIVAGRRHWTPLGGRAWSRLAASMALAAVADALWGLSIATGHDGLGGWSDIVYLLTFAVMVLAVLGLARTELAERVATMDAVITSVGFGVLVLTPVAQAMPAAVLPELDRWLALGYPLLSLLVGAVATRLLLSSRGRRPAFALVVAGLGAHVVSDAAYGLQAMNGTYAGGFVDLGWLCSYALLGASALHPSVTRPARPAWARDVTLSANRLLVLMCAALAPLVVHAVFGLAVSVATALVFALATIGLFRLAVPLEAHRRAASVDLLTGALNRFGVLERLEHVIARGHEGVAVLYCDLDRIKLVNDALGHTAGDALIAEVARRIVAAAPTSAHVARVAGDELLVVLTGTTEADALAMAHVLAEDVARPVVVEDVELRPSMCVGVALCGPADVPELLLTRGSVAMAKAKGIGRGTVVSAADVEHDAPRRLQLANDLAAALRAGHVTAHFQPEIDLTTGRLFGFEALARWHDPVRGAVPPCAFVPVAEEAGLVRELFVTVLDAALRTQHDCSRAVGQQVSMAINISPAQLGPDLVGDVRAAIERWCPAPGSVWLELTESTVADVADVAEVLGRLRELGVRLAIDDFGTGHSSLSRLAALPWDALKIDGSFVAGMLHERDARVLVESTIALGRALGLVTIAEGVESAPQRDALVAQGCDVLQGYLVSPPVDAASAETLAVRLATTGVPLGPA